MLEVTVYTAGHTQDSLDPHATLTAARFQAERERYISMLCDTVRDLYPDALVETAPGNGLDEWLKVYTPDENSELEAEATGRIEAAWMSTYERWTETVLT